MHRIPPRRRIALLTVFLVSVLSRDGGAGEPDPAAVGAPASLTFIVTSDCHYDAFENEDRNDRNRATLEEMNRIPGSSWPEPLGGGPIGRPRAALVLGDVIDDGDRVLQGRNQGAAQYEKFVADFGLDGTDGVLRYPVIEGWGNHDGPPAGRERHGFSFQAELRKRHALRKEKGIIENLSANGLHASWDWGPVHLVLLNLYPGDAPHPKTRYSPQYHDPQGSLTFLREDLAARVGSSGRPVVILHHYDLQGTDWWHPDERLAYYRAIRDYNVIAIFHGHTGTGVYAWKPEGEDRALDVINTGQTERGFFLVEISESRLRVAYRVQGARGPDGEGSWGWAHLLDRRIERTAAPRKPAGLRRPIGDKTLVAWVRLSDTAQRGGAALGLMEGEDFDAIVFGERVEARWMAGSDFFRRTESAEVQASWPAEATDASTTVQIAVAYAGDRVSLFRDGKAYGSYEVERPRAFGREAAVLIGLRYLASMGPIGFLRGAVEEARIYDVALEEAATAALAPGRPSDPAPIACWTFEDGSTADSVGTFPPGELRGGARVVDGRLELNGTDAYLVSRIPDDHEPSIFWAPRRADTGRMWDTWLFFRDGTYHLYCLANASSSWDNISMAVSPDGVRWKELGPILRKADGVTWMGTGFTWASPRHAEDGKFFLNFSEWRGDRQTIFFAESTDLLRWKRIGGELEFRQDTRWYQPAGRWDCIYAVPDPAGGLLGYWTADPEGRPGVGFGRSADGIRWEALEPPRFLDGAPHGEAGAVEELGGRWYLMLGSGGRMLALVADRPEGPFRPARKNPVLLNAGPTYFARFFPTSPDGVLVNHHSIARNGRVHLGLLKTPRVDPEGGFRLGWWRGNEALKRAKLDLGPPPAPTTGVAMLPVELPADDGFVLEGEVGVPKTAEAPRPGLWIETSPGAGTAAVVGPDGVVELGGIATEASRFAAELRVDRELAVGDTARLRLCLERWLLELYLDDVLVECWSLPARATGRIGLLEPAAFRDLRAWSARAESGPEAK